MDDKRVEELTRELTKQLNTEVEYRVVSKLNMTSADVFACRKANGFVFINFDPRQADQIIIHNVVKAYNAISDNTIDLEQMALNNLNDRDYVLKNVERSIIGTKLNMEYLHKIVHREYLDLSVIYRVVIRRSEHDRSSVVITQELADRLNLSITDLEVHSRLNQGDDYYVTTSLLKVLVESGTIPEEIASFENDEYYPMYVVSSKDGINGATSILHTSIFTGLAETLKDDLYIMPSSIHELICVPCQGQPAYFFKEMVASVNREVVADNEILGNSVYIYKRRTKTISIAN